MWGYSYWPWYLIIASIAFIIPEFYGIFTNAANTLSDYCWHELSVNVMFGNGRHTIAWWLSLIGWGTFVVLITLHIWWRAT
jgi:hypothetical protein